MHFARSTTYLVLAVVALCSSAARADDWEEAKEDVLSVIGDHAYPGSAALVAGGATRGAFMLAERTVVPTNVTKNALYRFARAVTPIYVGASAYHRQVKRAPTRSAGQRTSPREIGDLLQRGAQAEVRHIRNEAMDLRDRAETLLTGRSTEVRRQARRFANAARDLPRRAAQSFDEQRSSHYSGRSSQSVRDEMRRRYQQQ